VYHITRVVCVTRVSFRYISAYLSSFFSLPVKRESGEHLTHEQVINQLDDDTVSYEVSLGMSSQFTELLRVSLKVETGMYDAAVSWLKDLLYGSEFTKERYARILVSRETDHRPSS
jgi:Zn-dependent M16 (insulinase) family peptidase